MREKKTFTFDTKTETTKIEIVESMCRLEKDSLQRLRMYARGLMNK